MSLFGDSTVTVPAFVSTGFFTAAGERGTDGQEPAVDFPTGGTDDIGASKGC